MITIPIDVDEDLVRAGIQHAAAEQFASRIRNINDLIAALSGGGIIDRAEWSRYWAQLDASRTELAPALEYAQAFADQWAVEDEE